MRGRGGGWEGKGGGIRRGGGVGKGRRRRERTSSTHKHLPTHRFEEGQHEKGQGTEDVRGGQLYGALARRQILCIGVQHVTRHVDACLLRVDYR